MSTIKIFNNENTRYLAILAKRQRASLHIKDTGDVIPLSEPGQGQGLLSIVVQVAAVRSVQPHVTGRSVAVIVNGIPRHAHARAFIATILFGN